MRIPFACLLLLFGTVLSQDVTERYSKFINHHIKGDMSAGRCTSVIGGKSISESDSHVRGPQGVVVFCEMSYFVKCCCVF